MKLTKSSGGSLAIGRTHVSGGDEAEVEWTVFRGRRIDYAVDTVQSCVTHSTLQALRYPNTPCDILHNTIIGLNHRT